MKIKPALTLSLCTTLMASSGCDDGGASDATGTSGGADTDASSTTPTPGSTGPASTISAGSSGSGSSSSGTDTEGTDTEGTDTEGTDTEGTDTEGTDTEGMETGDTGGQAVDPADLPYGGYIELVTNGTIAFGSGRFRTITNADEPGFEPSGPAAPLLGPRESDYWYSYAAPPKPEPQSPLEYALLDVGPEFSAAGGNVSLTMPYDEEQGLWTSGQPLGLKETWTGGPWDIVFEGSDAVPAGVIEGVLPTPPQSDIAFEIVTDVEGVPTGLAWDPMDAQEIFFFSYAFGDGGQFLLMCFGSLVDDGAAEFPEGCIDLEGLAAADYTAVSILAGPSYQVDVAHGGYRFRVNNEVQQEMLLPYPFE